MNILPYGGKTPKVASCAFVAPNAMLIGDVEIAEDASVWFGCVLRGDVGAIRVGRGTNVQDLTCVHMTDSLSVTTLGERITVGHGVILHGCTVEDEALIGMGSILLDNVVVGAQSLIAAGTLVPPRMVIPPRSLVRGSPAKIVREVSEEERAMGVLGAMHYIENAKRYRSELAALRTGAVLGGPGEGET